MKYTLTLKRKQNWLDKMNAFFEKDFLFWIIVFFGILFTVACLFPQGI